jgi:Fatty acid desaturase
MAPTEDADITPFEMSCAGGTPPPARAQLGWGCAWTISSTGSKVTPSRASLAGTAVAAADARSVQLTRQVLRTAGIYDLRIHHDEILWPLLRYWNLFDLESLQPQADQARERLAAHLAKTDRLASRFEAKRMRATEAPRARVMTC